MSDVDIELANEIGNFYDNPLGFVLFAFPWGEPGTSLQGFSGPDAWQVQVLNDIGGEVMSRRFNGVDPVDPIQVAVSSGHG